MVKLIENPMIPGIDVPFKQSNPSFPPDKEVIALIKTPLLQRMASQENNVDCSEIAYKIYSKVLRGAILYYAELFFTWPKSANNFDLGKFQKQINIPETRDGKIYSVPYSYHAVYSDGRYVYDPVVSTEAIVKSDYIKLLKGLNSGRISSRHAFGYSTLFKCEFSG